MLEIIFFSLFVDDLPDLFKSDIIMSANDLEILNPIAANRDPDLQTEVNILHR